MQKSTNDKNSSKKTNTDSKKNLKSKKNWESTWNVEVKTVECVSCWACVAITSDHEIFEFDDDVRCIVKNQPKSKDQLEAVKEAIEACPVEAIKLKKNS